METNIQIGLRSISEISYLYRPEKIGERLNPESLQISFKNDIRGLEVGNDFMSMIFGVQYVYNNEELLHCVYAFDFNIKNLKNFVVFGVNKSVTVNMIMPILLDTALGTLRGVILAKTYGTPLYAFPLPIINVEQIIQNLNNKDAN